MPGLVECIPNFSEGRRKEVVDAITAAISGVDGVRLLDRELDPDHNRSVVTFVGTPAGVAEAAFRAAAKAAELIDMEQHTGQHPRLGATDVIPFVPIRDVTMKECVKVAKEVGARIAQELRIPVYLYEEAATRPDRVNLADIRKGEYEGLKAVIGSDADRRPDFGEARMHPRAGATVVGARYPLVAFNVNLGTEDLKVAQAIAKAVRHSSGGLRYVKALGFELKERKIVQVSMNMTRFELTPLSRAFEMVRHEAERYGVRVVGSEIVGLIPLDAIVQIAEHALRLEKFSKDQILETKLWE